MTATPYDLVAYPSTVHPTTHPDRLAVAARLMGLDPVPLNEARVLEIGGGTCLGLIAFAAAYPGSNCHGFDLAPSAIARGRELAGTACPNVTLAVADIMDARHHYPAGGFDYVIAHGVYAWVPDPVQRALMDLIAHALSPRGVAFVSYNAMPGGHIRLILREMVLHAITGITDRDERIAAAYAFLREYAGTKAVDDDPIDIGLRKHAENMVRRPASVLFHDEMGAWYSPQSLSDVVHAARDSGLRYLTDIGRNRVFDGFLADESRDAADPDAEVLRAAQRRDFLDLAFFRSSLLVPEAAAIDRRMDPARIDDLWVSTEVEPLGGGEFAVSDDRFDISDGGLAERLAQLAARWPGRAPLHEIAVGDEQRQALLALYRESYVAFHSGREPFVVTPGDPPETHPWIRDLLQRGENAIVSLGHNHMRIDQSELRALLIAADGQRALDALASFDHGIPAEEVLPALQAAAQKGLLRR